LQLARQTEMFFKKCPLRHNWVIISWINCISFLFKHPKKNHGRLTTSRPSPVRGGGGCVCVRLPLSSRLRSYLKNGERVRTPYGSTESGGGGARKEVEVALAARLLGVSSLKKWKPVKGASGVGDHGAPSRRRRGLIRWLPDAFPVEQGLRGPRRHHGRRPQRVVTETYKRINYSNIL